MLLKGEKQDLSGTTEEQAREHVDRNRQIRETEIYKDRTPGTTSADIRTSTYNIACSNEHLRTAASERANSSVAKNNHDQTVLS